MLDTGHPAHFQRAGMILVGLYVTLAVVHWVLLVLFVMYKEKWKLSLVTASTGVSPLEPFSSFSDTFAAAAELEFDGGAPPLANQDGDVLGYLRTHAPGWAMLGFVLAAAVTNGAGCISLLRVVCQHQVDLRAVYNTAYYFGRLISGVCGGCLLIVCISFRVAEGATAWQHPFASGTVVTAIAWTLFGTCDLQPMSNSLLGPISNGFFAKNKTIGVGCVSHASHGRSRQDCLTPEV